MKKKLIISVLLVGLLAFGAGMGTLAYFTKTFTSSSNTITAATFDVNSNGTLDSNTEFAFDNVYPGYTGFYDFEVNKTATEVPVKYIITVTPSGDLFGFTHNETAIASAIKMGLQRSVNGKMNHTNNRDYDYVVDLRRGTITYEIEAEFDEEMFRLVWEWPHGANDNLFQSKSGSVTINVEAQQIPETSDTTILAGVVVNAEGTRYPIYDANDPATYEAQNRILVEGNKLFIFDNAYYGDLELEVTNVIVGAPDDYKYKGDATIISSSLKPELNGNVYKITHVSDSYLHIRNQVGGDWIIEINAPAGSYDNLFQ